MPLAKPLLRWVALAGTLLVCGALGLAWVAYERTGRTPGELMDYAERRLEGHPKLETLALPAFGILRDWLNAPARAERQARKFVIPPPPPLSLAANASVAATDAGEPAGRILRVGPKEALRSIAEAAKLARDGDTVEIQAGEYHGDVSVWPQRKLTIRGVGGSARLFADGKSAEDKAIWVIRNGEFDIANIDFIGARVSDRNGAGIRFERGRLRVRNCLFWGNENGILTTGDDQSKQAVLEIEDSEFAYNGHGDGYSHNLYVGPVARLRVTGSYFHHANTGHLLKSRAERSEILYNRLSDESGGRASYELDLPNGGIAIVLGNIIQQSRETENSTLIAYGEEGYSWPTNSLFIASNTLVNDHPHGGAFLRAAPRATKIVSANNVFSGKGKYHAAQPFESINDVHGDWSWFAQPARHDYRLAEGRQNIRFQAPPTDSAPDIPLIPGHEYVHPRAMRELAAAPGSAGALQTPARQ